MGNVIIAGCGTDVGKTVVSAITTVALQGDYWKPIECGNPDSAVVRSLINPEKYRIHTPRYSFQAPLSPHAAAQLENQSISIESFQIPSLDRPLVIEMAGGILTPLTTKLLNIDLFQKWKARWIIVSKHYLGSINHTLLTLQVLKQYNIEIGGIIFNGTPNQSSETAILEFSQVPFLGRIFPEPKINRNTIERYAQQWPSHI